MLKANSQPLPMWNEPEEGGLLYFRLCVRVSVAISLNLTADHGYYLNLRYIGRDHSKYTMGQWQFSDNNTRLTLLRDDEAPVYFPLSITPLC